ncbi:MAG: S9 family peptidase [Anaeromyxobacter sp.]
MPCWLPLASALLLAAPAVPAQAAPPGARPLSITDLLAIERVAEPALAPDGRLVAFTVARASQDGERLFSSLFVVPSAGGPARQLTFGEERVSGPVFSPDGRQLAFGSARSGSRQAWVIDLAGGEARRVTGLPGGVDAIAWAPDGRALLVTAEVDPACGADAACNQRSQDEAAKRPHLATGLLFRHWDEWRGRGRAHALLVPLDGKPATDLTPGERDVPPGHRGGGADLAFSPDGRTLYVTAMTDAVEATSTNADLYAVPVAGGPLRQLTSGAGWDGTPRPSPDGKRLAWLSQARAGYESDRHRVMLAAVDGSGAKDLTAAFDLSASELHWTRGGKALRFLAETAGRSELYELDVASGAIARLTRGLELDGLSTSADGKVAVALASSMRAPAEVVRLEKAGGELAARPLTSFGQKALSGIALGEVRALTTTGEDGKDIHGWLVLPPGHREGERHPAVVLIHGGPQGAWHDGWGYRWNPQLYAAQGWAVILPNPRGSTGWGQAYVDAVRDDWGGTPFQDIMRLADAGIAAGVADGQRMCAAGASYGGYMVNWINGHTDRFRCLVAHAGDFHLEAAYYDTEELWFPEWELKGTPWQNPESYARWSPHRFVERWKTPTFVTHGERDFRVTVTQGISTYTALQRRGIPSRLMVFPDENHWILKPRNAKVFHDEVLGWIRGYLGGAGAEPARAQAPAP